MNLAGHTKNPPVTRERLLEAAGEVFAERGFRAATIRDICESAAANVAAVNYHFRDKASLYAEVLRHAHRCTPDPAGLPPITNRAVAAEQLRAFVESFLIRVLDDSQPLWPGKLLARELSEPTTGLDVLVAESIRPRFEYLSKIVATLLGPAATPERVRLCAMSVVGQTLHYFHARPVIARLTGQKRIDPERVADHIASFSLAAMERLAEAGGPR